MKRRSFKQATAVPAKPKPLTRNQIIYRQTIAFVADQIHKTQATTKRKDNTNET